MGLGLGGLVLTWWRRGRNGLSRLMRFIMFRGDWKALRQWSLGKMARFDREASVCRRVIGNGSCVQHRYP